MTTQEKPADGSQTGITEPGTRRARRAVLRPTAAPERADAAHWAAYMTGKAESLAILAEMFDEASLAPKRCRQGEAVFFLADDEARVPGHIYSSIGRSEFNISMLCEYHFDKFFSNPEDTEDLRYREDREDKKDVL